MYSSMLTLEKWQNSLKTYGKQTKKVHMILSHHAIHKETRRAAHNCKKWIVNG